MNYIGHSYTRTPCHVDICASIGHNMMVHSDPSACAYWFVAKGNDLTAVEKFWRENGSALRSEHHFMDI